MSLPHSCRKVLARTNRLAQALLPALVDTRKHLSVRKALPLALLFIVTFPTHAATEAQITGAVADPTGAVVPDARVQLLRGSDVVAETTTDARGNFELAAPTIGRYRLRASAKGFARQETKPFFVSPGKPVHEEIALQIGPVAEQIVVSATGTETPDSRVGASISVITPEQLANRIDMLDVLPQIPGLQASQNGERGALGSIFIRGGNSNANKILLDGIPINEIGGVVDFGFLAATAIDHAEVLRGPNSVLYGSDAMAGVVNLTTRRGTTPLPEINYSFDAGNFNTLHHDISLGGAFRRLDYLGEFSRFDTGNSIPNDTFHNGTYVANLGLALNSTTELRLTGRYTTTAVGEPGQIEFFGIPDDSFLRDQDSYLGVTFQNQTNRRWHNLMRYASTRVRRQNVNPSPSGIPFNDGFGDINFVGVPVTIKGANGFSVSGQGILDFAGTYPMTNSSTSKRDSVYAQSDFSVNSHLLLLGGFRYENERGFSLIGASNTPLHRGNFSYIAEVQSSLGSRAYAALGGSVEDNAVFGVVAVPRVSLAFYPVRPRSDGFLNGTKVKFNYGQGIKEPDIFESTESLFGLLQSTPGGQQTISQFHILPIAAERSRSYDFGTEQLAWHGRARLGATFFYNQFTNQIEFVPSTALPLLGVPPGAIPVTAFGAFFNSGQTRALGVETELEFHFGHGLSARGGYTYLDEVLQKSSSFDAFACAQPGQPFCSINPAFPTIPIGAFAPLLDARPFRRAPHTGFLSLNYSQPRFTLGVNGTFVSRRDDSTFLSDQFGGLSLLLPNRNLDPSYQKIDLTGSFRANHHLAFFAVIENLLDQRYDQAIGFPALPLTFRTGFRVTWGGETWK